jgi:hypothetical protein
MGTRTVRLDDEAERTLERLRTITGLSISEILKQGLRAYEGQALALNFGHFCSWAPAPHMTPRRCRNVC